MIEAPPLETGAVHETRDSPFAAPVADTPVGAPGTAEGTTEEEAADAEPIPDTFVAVTVNEYDVPFVRPRTVHEVEAVVQVNEPGFEVTVYRLIAAPLLAGAVQETNAEASIAPVATTEDGASGTAEGTTDNDAEEAVPVPDTFVAVTVNEYDVPFVRPETVHEVVAVMHWNPPGFEVTVYCEIEAPFDAGAVHETTDWVFAAAVAATDVGASGTAEGTIEEDETEAEPVPDTFVAVTENE